MPTVGHQLNYFHSLKPAAVSLGSLPRLSLTSAAAPAQAPAAPAHTCGSVRPGQGHRGGVLAQIVACQVAPLALWQHQDSAGLGDKTEPRLAARIWQLLTDMPTWFAVKFIAGREVGRGIGCQICDMIRITMQ